MLGFEGGDCGYLEEGVEVGGGVGYEEGEGFVDEGAEVWLGPLLYYLCAKNNKRRTESIAINRNPPSTWIC